MDCGHSTISTTSNKPLPLLTPAVKKLNQLSTLGGIMFKGSSPSYEEAVLVYGDLLGQFSNYCTSMATMQEP